MYVSKFKYTYPTDTPANIELAKKTDEILTRIIDFSPNPNQKVFSYSISWAESGALLNGADVKFREEKNRKNKHSRSVHWYNTIQDIESVKNQLTSSQYGEYALYIFKIIFEERNTSLPKLMTELSILIDHIRTHNSDYRAVAYEEYGLYERGGISGNNYYVPIGQR